MKILIADSGSTKTDWCVAEENEITVRFTTAGMNPFHQTEEQIESEIRAKVLPYIPAFVEKVCFYGSGCTEEKKTRMRKVLEKTFRASAQAESDLLGAARSLCGEQPGIACILGTGSNSCFYDGGKIAAHVSPLGYILGDEGSGSDIGKRFLNRILKSSLQADKWAAEALKRIGMRPEEILEQVYRRPFPNRFLAGLVPLVFQMSREEPYRKEACEIIKAAFGSFFEKNLWQYDYEHFPVHFTGSVAYYLQDHLRCVYEKLEIGNITQGPMEGLVEYHAKKR